MVFLLCATGEGSCKEAYTVYLMGARFYDPALGRFIQADTVVPPESKRVAVTPLQVGAFEPEYVAQIGQENREVAAYGYSFQRDARTLSRTKAHLGPPDPQRLNRYSYASNNPLRYVDLTGHFPVTYQQFLTWVAYVTETLFELVGQPLPEALADVVVAEMLEEAVETVTMTPGPWWGILLGTISALWGSPGEAYKAGFLALGYTMMEAKGFLEAKVQTWGDRVTIDVEITYYGDHYAVLIRVCAPDGCGYYNTGPVSPFAMEGYAFGPTGFFDFLGYGDDWGYYSANGEYVYGFEWWSNHYGICGLWGAWGGICY